MCKKFVGSRVGEMFIASEGSISAETVNENP
jgi:hypothetical protein